MLSLDLILKEIQIKMEVSLGSRTSGWISGFDNSLVGNRDPDAGSKWVVINPGLLRVRVTKTSTCNELGRKMKMDVLTFTRIIQQCFYNNISDVGSMVITRSRWLIYY